MFHHEDSPTVVRKRLSFVSVAAICLSSFLIVVILSASMIAVYGLHVVDRKSDSLVDLVAQAAKSLPEYRAALPPVLADAIDDVRDPSYRDHLDVAVQLRSRSEGNRRRSPQATVRIRNDGDKVVSVLGLRLIGLDSDGVVVTEQNAYAATPLLIEDDWRGPLLPGSTRTFPVWFCYSSDPTDLMWEITELRVWDEDQAEKGVTAVVPADTDELEEQDDDAENDDAEDAS